MATIFGVFVGDANKRFNGGLADAHGGQVSPVNSSYKDMRGVCENAVKLNDKRIIVNVKFFIGK